MKDKELPHKIDFRDRKIKKGSWALKVTVMTFFISLILGFLSDLLSKNINIYLACLVLIIIIFIGILFDIVGIAIASADEKPINAMAARKIKGAKQALALIKNVDKMTNICNDVIGDIAGIISGATGVTIGAYIYNIVMEKIKNAGNPLAEIFVFTFVSAVAAALTVGGKAAGKKIAIKKADDIVFMAGRVISVFNTNSNTKN